MVTSQMLYPSFLLIGDHGPDFDYSGVPLSGEDITGLLLDGEFGESEDPFHPGLISGKVIETLATTDQTGLRQWTQIEVVFSTQQDLDNFLQFPWTRLLEDYIKDCS